MKELSNEIRAYALKNALEFGKADASKILPKLFQHGLDKKDIKSTMPEIIRLVNEVNKLSKEGREKEYDKYKEYVRGREEEEKGLPELPESSGKMVFRIAPFPSGALHIGNAKTFLLNAMYAKKYNGKLILVMDDTIGSKEKPISKEAYNLIEEGFKWLGVKYGKPVIYKSDRIEIYYKYAEQLINKDKAYACFCSQESLRKNREKGIECEHRKQSVDENLNFWKKMFKEKEGGAVLRVKTSMQHPNPAFRDRVLFRIADREHARIGKKYRVWPTLEMTWAIDDHLLGITHVIRGNDLMIESEMQKYIWDVFGWKKPVLIHTGFVKIEGIEGAKLSKSKAQKEVKSGKFIGWDDPRTWSIQSLKRRGILAETIRQFVEEIGLNKADISIPVDSLYAINRKIVDSKALRYFFVADPVELKIENAPSVKEVEMPVHPDMPEKKKKLGVGEIFISMDDAKKFSNSEVRLLHLYNIELGEEILKGKLDAFYSSSDIKNIPKIHWVSSGLPARVLMPDGAWRSGVIESNAKSLKEGEIVQFERFGFARFDKVNKKVYEFWFAHK